MVKLSKIKNSLIAGAVAATIAATPVLAASNKAATEADPSLWNQNAMNAANQIFAASEKSVVSSKTSEITVFNKKKEIKSKSRIFSSDRQKFANSKERISAQNAYCPTVKFRKGDIAPFKITGNEGAYSQMRDVLPVVCAIDQSVFGNKNDTSSTTEVQRALKASGINQNSMPDGQYQLLVKTIRNNSKADTIDIYLNRGKKAKSTTDTIIPKIPKAKQIKVAKKVTPIVAKKKSVTQKISQTNILPDNKRSFLSRTDRIAAQKKYCSQKTYGVGDIAPFNIEGNEGAYSQMRDFFDVICAIDQSVFGDKSNVSSTTEVEKALNSSGITPNSMPDGQYALLVKAITTNKKADLVDIYQKVGSLSLQSNKNSKAGKLEKEINLSTSYENLKLGDTAYFNIDGNKSAHYYIKKSPKVVKLIDEVYGNPSDGKLDWGETNHLLTVNAINESNMKNGKYGVVVIRTKNGKATALGIAKTGTALESMITEALNKNKIVPEKNKKPVKVSEIPKLTEKKVEVKKVYGKYSFDVNTDGQLDEVTLNTTKNNSPIVFVKYNKVNKTEVDLNSLRHDLIKAADFTNTEKYSLEDMQSYILYSGDSAEDILRFMIDSNQFAKKPKKGSDLRLENRIADAYGWASFTDKVANKSVRANYIIKEMVKQAGQDITITSDKSKIDAYSGAFSDDRTLTQLFAEHILGSSIYSTLKADFAPLVQKDKVMAKNRGAYMNLNILNIKKGGPENLAKTAEESFNTAKVSYEANLEAQTTNAGGVKF